MVTRGEDDVGTADVTEVGQAHSSSSSEEREEERFWTASESCEALGKT
jgi:hypothetical protein